MALLSHTPRVRLISLGAIENQIWGTSLCTITNRRRRWTRRQEEFHESCNKLKYNQSYQLFLHPITGNKANKNHLKFGTRFTEYTVFGQFWSLTIFTGAQPRIVRRIRYKTNTHKERNKYSHFRICISMDNYDVDLRCCNIYPEYISAFYGTRNVSNVFKWYSCEIYCHEGRLVDQLDLCWIHFHF